MVHLVLGTIPKWTLGEHKKVHDDYFRNQDTRRGIKVPDLLEAGLSLVLAERHRVSGSTQNARDLVALAVENYPGHAPLYDLEKAFDPSMPIDWRRIVFPESEAADAV